MSVWLERFVLAALATILGATVLTNPWRLDRIQQGALIVAIVAISVFAARTVEKMRMPETAAVSTAPSGPASGTNQSAGSTSTLTANPTQESPKQDSAAHSPALPVEPASNSALPPSQVMVNSSGGIQAGRDVIISGDAQLIRSIELHLSIETKTAPAPIGPEHFDWGLGSVLALFTTDKRRFRFVSDLRVHDQQLGENRRRLQ